MVLTLLAQDVPLRTDEYGTVRVGQTRVTLDLVMAAFQEGYSAEEIVHHFPALDLGDVYAVIAYYLHHQAEVDAYLAEQERETQAVLKDLDARQQGDPLRARLLALRAQRTP